MTAMPLPESETDSIHLLTIAEYAALGETEHGYTELVEGRVVVSPSPAPDHNNAALELAFALRPLLPEAYQLLLDTDIDLGLAPIDEAGSSRRPDLMVIHREARKRVRAEGGMIRATEVVLVVEVVSPSSKRIDHRHKRNDYADAGIPHYWIVDIDEPVALTECRLTDDFGYQDNQVATGEFTTDVPFPVSVSLGPLV
jgi:Uma2 family endonuclease